MQHNWKEKANQLLEGLALLMAAVTVMCGIPGVDAQAESKEWTVYEKGTSNSKYTDAISLIYVSSYPHFMKANLIDSTDIEAYVNVEGVNVKYWDLTRERYYNYYGLASTSVQHRFSLVLRSSSTQTSYSQFLVDATHMTEFFIFEGAIWN